MRPIISTFDIDCQDVSVTLAPHATPCGWKGDPHDRDCGYQQKKLIYLALSHSSGWARQHAVADHAAAKMPKPNVFHTLIPPCVKFLVSPGYDEGDS